MYSSKHLDRTRSKPGSEQIRPVNSIKVLNNWSLVYRVREMEEFISKQNK